MGSIAHYLNPGVWSGISLSGIAGLAPAEFWSATLQIIFVNILLSGDNAVIIAMACRRLAPRQRVWGLVIGAGLAVILRIIFAALLSSLLEYPYLKIVGGIALIAIAAKLVVPEDDEGADIEPATRLWRAVRIVLVADIVMSFDNILAIVEISHGALVLLAVGLAVSIPLVIAGAALIAALFDRLPILVWAGTALLGWVGGQTIFDDRTIVGPVTHALGEALAQRAELASGCGGLVLALAAGALWRHWHALKPRH